MSAKDLKEIKELEEKVIRLESKIDLVLELLKRQNGALEDHENRLRDLEKTKNKVIGVSVSSLITAMLSIIKSFLK